MIPIPSHEIRQPSFHADELGFVFVWQGHLLRGIYPQSLDRVKDLFESGLLPELMDRGLFPKTWISDFENEQFGLIIEHERITPVTFATEWNFQMLKDAALLVLEIVQTARKYGYDLLDCFKMNVLFRRNKPLYIDLGSFVPARSALFGWHSFPEFLSSYYYILDVWRSGAPQIAKRMMLPHEEMADPDYWAYKSRLLRTFPSLLSLHIAVRKKWNGLVNLDDGQIDAYAKKWGSLAGKVLAATRRIATRWRLAPPLRFRRLERKIRHFQADMPERAVPELTVTESVLIDVLNDRWPDCRQVTVVNNRAYPLYEALLAQTGVRRIFAINEDELRSREEYLYYQDKDLDVSCMNFVLSEREVLVRDKFPEARFASSLVLLPSFTLEERSFRYHNALVLLERLLLYTTEKTIVMTFKEMDSALIDTLRNHFTIDLWKKPGGQDTAVILSR